MNFHLVTPLETYLVETSTLVGSTAWPPQGVKGGLDLDDLEGPFHPKL